MMMKRKAGGMVFGAERQGATESRKSVDVDGREATVPGKWGR